MAPHCLPLFSRNQLSNRLLELINAIPTATRENTTLPELLFDIAIRAEKARNEAQKNFEIWGPGINLVGSNQQQQQHHHQHGNKRHKRGGGFNSGGGGFGSGGGLNMNYPGGNSTYPTNMNYPEGNSVYPGQQVYPG